MTTFLGCTAALLWSQFQLSLATFEAWAHASQRGVLCDCGTFLGSSNARVYNLAVRLMAEGSLFAEDTSMNPTAGWRLPPKTKHTMMAV